MIVHGQPGLHSQTVKLKRRMRKVKQNREERRGGRPKLNDKKYTTVDPRGLVSALSFLMDTKSIGAWYPYINSIAFAYSYNCYVLTSFPLSI